MNLDKETSTVLGGVSIAIIAIIGIILFSSFASIDIDKQDTEYFSVTNTSIDRTCNLDYFPSSDGALTVEYNNGTGYRTLTLTTDYTVVGNVVTVKSSALS